MDPARAEAWLADAAAGRLRTRNTLRGPDAAAYPNSMRVRIGSYNAFAGFLGLPDRRDNQPPARGFYLTPADTQRVLYDLTVRRRRHANAAIALRTAAVAALVADTGRGVPELAGLTVSALHLDGEARVDLDDGSCPLGGPAVQILTRWLEARAEIIAELEGSDPGYLWIPTKPGRPRGGRPPVKPGLAPRPCGPCTPPTAPSSAACSAPRSAPVPCARQANVLIERWALMRARWTGRGRRPLAAPRPRPRCPCPAPCPAPSRSAAPGTTTCAIWTWTFRCGGRSPSSASPDRGRRRWPSAPSTPRACTVSWRRLSTYSRRRLTQAQRPDVDRIDHLPPALALRQRPPVPGPRSTVGTMTEVLNVLRLMMSRLGSHLCPNGHLVAPSVATQGMEIVCPVCGAHFEHPSAESFSFNSYGACPACNGLGVRSEVDADTLVPDQDKTIEEGAVLPWNAGVRRLYQYAARELGVRLDVPYRELTPREQDIVLHGEPVQQRVTFASGRSGRPVQLNVTYENAIATVERGAAQ